MPRWLTTTLILLAAVLITSAFFANSQRPGGGDTPPTQTPPKPPAASTGENPLPPATPADGVTPESPDGTTPPPPPPATGDAAPLDQIAGLHVVAVDKQPEPEIGSTEPDADRNPFMLKARFTPFGGAVRHIQLSRYSTQVDSHDPLPVVEARIVESTSSARGYAVYPLAAWQVVVNGGDPIYLANRRWQAGEPVVGPDGSRSVTFTLTLADGDDKPVLRIDRAWRVTPGRYDLRVSNTVSNLTDRPLDVRLDQLGPIDLIDDGGYMGDRRSVVIGYMRPGYAESSPRQATTEDHHTPRATAIDAQTDAIFPAPDENPAHELLWAAMSNRYFTVVTHAVVAPDRAEARTISGEVRSIHRITWGPGASDTAHTTLGLIYNGATRRLAPASSDASAAAQHTAALGVYAGPLEPAILKKQPEYVALRMGELIVYNLGGFCAFCTFDWLAVGLLNFLTLVHSLVLDWGLAIIILVAIVRIILHPLTKRSQVNMMKMGKQMQQLQPEVERIKAKHADSKEKLNAEMMKLYKERGVNPAAMGLGCLPMFLQMPIWFALYAMLFFAIELRHEPAFYDVFHKLGAMVGIDWRFLSDLSAEDNFITFPRFSVFGLFTLSSVNLLPFLMAAVFWFQQKYTVASTPPANEQIAQQQKMMKWMVLLFPVFLYKAPSGLNLYILTSTFVGVIESKRVRDHLKELEESGKLFEKKPPKPGGFMDRISKAVEAKQKAIMEKKGGGSSPPNGGGPSGGGGGKKNKPRGKGGQRF